MRIAIVHDKGMVSQHFGRAPELVIVEIENDQVIKKETVASPGHGSIPHFLAQRDVKVVLAGGMGGGAMQRCQEYGIEPILGIQGAIDQVIDQYIKKQLKSVPILCDGQGEGHHGDCEHGQHHRGYC